MSAGLRDCLESSACTERPRLACGSFGGSGWAGAPTVVKLTLNNKGDPVCIHYASNVLYIELPAAGFFLLL